MPRFTATLLATLFALAALVALFCGGDKNEVAATPTAKSVAPGGFEFSLCGEEAVCLSRVIEDMANFIGGQ